jgi:manganese/iron transport system substrate-binding protein
MAVHLAELLPAQAADIEARAEAYRAELDRLYQEISQLLDRIPTERRVLISSEAAFIYFADAFEFFHDGIWGNNAESEGAPRQLMRIIDIIDQRRPPALFWESTVSSRAVETVSLDAGVPHFGPLYVDSLGEPGSEADNYPDMLRANARLLIQALLDGR